MLRLVAPGRGPGASIWAGGIIDFGAGLAWLAAHAHRCSVVAGAAHCGPRKMDAEAETETVKSDQESTFGAADTWFRRRLDVACLPLGWFLDRMASSARPVLALYGSK